MLRKVKNLSLCFLSAILLILPFIKSNLWIFAWVGFVPMFFAIQGKSKLQVFILSYLTGVLFFLGTIYWLIHVTLGGLIILVFYLGLYFAIFGLFFSIYCKPTTINFLIISSFWVILEYVRNYIFTGFGWAILGYSQCQNLPVVQIADVTGVYGISFIIILTNVFIYFILQKKYDIRNAIYYILILITVLAYGYFRISEKIEDKRLRISVIQGNIPQAMKWDHRYNNFIKDKYFTLTKTALLENSDLIIWPEAAFPEALIWPKDARTYFSSVNYKRILFGAVVLENNEYYNSAILIEKNKLRRYDKLHLVPFGEYIPLKRILPFLETVVGIGDFRRGKDYTIFKIQNPKSKIQNKFAVLICFEDLFSNLARNFTNRGAEFLVNITNDAWFGDTIEPFGHMSFSVLRAIENRRFVVRAANTGISCFIDSKGKVYSSVKNKQGKATFIEGIDTKEIILSNKKTFYTKFGDLFVLFNLLFLIFNLNYEKKTQC